MTDIVLITTTEPSSFRHEESIVAGVAAIGAWAQKAGLSLLHTEDCSVLSDLVGSSDLAGVRAVIFLQCNGEILNDEQRDAFTAAVRAGCGFAAVHNPTAAERGWPGYLDLIGARFAGHPPLDDRPRPLRVVADDPSTAGLPPVWSWSDEWYEFEDAPVGVEPLVVLDEDPSRAVAWRGQLGRGRTWYTSLGHRGEAWSDELFAAHVWGGITGILAD